MIYILIKKPTSSVYENGCFQQSLFVYYAVKNAGFPVKLVSTEYTAEETFNNIIIYNIDKLIDECKMLIMVSSIVSDKSFLKLLKQHNIKIIGYNCGNLYYIYQEDLIFDKHNVIGERTFGNKYFDQIWTIPNYKDQTDFIEAITDTPCISVPYVWDSDFVMECKYIVKKNTTTYNIIIFEPNMNMTKTCLIPLYICNELFNSGYNITAFVVAKPNTNAFEKLCKMFAFKIEAYPRMVSYEVLNQLTEKTCAMNIVLSHQKDNPLNFLHLEMIYLGYPLVHNSGKIKDMGYYYETIEDGKRQIVECINNYNVQNFTKNKMSLERFSAHNKENYEIYGKLIKTIMEKKYKYINVIYSGNSERSMQLWYELSTPVWKHIPGAKHIHVKHSESYEYNDNELYILVGVHEFTKFPKHYICYNFEQLKARQQVVDASVFNAYIERLKGGVQLWDYSKYNVEFLKKAYKAPNTIHVPFINNNLPHFKCECENKQLNVIFCGNYEVERRTRFLKLCKTQVLTTDNIWNNKKCALFAKSKILLDVHVNEPSLSLNPYARYAYGFFYKCLIIAERTSDWKDLEDFVIFFDTPDEMNEKIEYYLTNHNERTIITDRAYNMWVNSVQTCPLHYLM